MSDRGSLENLKQEIVENIYTNENQAVTGDLLQDVLIDAVDTMGVSVSQNTLMIGNTPICNVSGYDFIDVISTDIEPISPTKKVFYIAATGTYTHFGETAVTIPVGMIGIFKFNEYNEWKTELINCIYNENTINLNDNNKFIYALDGSIQNGSNYSISALIDLQEVSKFLAKIRTTANVATYAYYKEDGTFISAVEKLTLEAFTITEHPQNARFIRFCQRVDMSVGGYVIGLYDKYATNEALTTKADKIKAIATNVPFDMDGKFVNKADGQIYNGDDFATSNLFNINNLQKIHIQITSQGGCSSLTYYDEKGNFISSIGNTTKESPVEILPKDIPDNAFYVRFSLRKSVSTGGYVLMYFDSYNTILPSLWKDKGISAYGDSVVAINNGSFIAPFTFDLTDKWLLRAASYYRMGKAYGRGVGGQSYVWGTNGGALVYVNETTGGPVSREDSHNYDEYVANPSAFNVPDGCIATRGCLASWDRIKKNYPEGVKENIDVVMLMCHNDAVEGIDLDTDATFVENSQVDKEWYSSSEYVTYGGDYNINTLKGAIASTIMKFQAWMPDAIIVLLTPISGRGVTAPLNKGLTDTLMQKVAQDVRDMHELMSIPLIDMYANCGINGLNRTRYIADSIHPYTVDGSKMLARTIIGGLSSILPNIV